MAWTKQQSDAINARGSSVIVSAAAGSGKTSVLVQRLIGIIADTENKVPADRIVVVTFTRDAAAEMKQRLSAALSELIEDNNENQWLNQQQLMLQSAKIATIHSFCFDLIRENIQELDITPGFRIMDEVQSKITVSGCVCELVDEYYEKHSEEISFLYDNFCSKDDVTLENLISDIYQYELSVPYGELWLRKCTQKYQDEKTCDMYCSMCLDKIISLLREASELSAMCTGLISEADLPKCADILDNEYFSISKLLGVMESGDYELHEKLQMYIPPQFARLVMGKNIDPSIKERIQSARDRYKEIINKTVSDYISLIAYSKDDFSTHFRVLQIISAMISELEKKIWKVKTEKNCIDFSDAERLAVRLLSETDENYAVKKSPLAQTLSEYYKVIMIDEFQDTNNNQDLIFKLLSHNGTAEKTGDNLFAVGDVKQSIYGFRLANPKNFINAVSAAVPYSQRKDCENAYIMLNRNFRSSREVIDFVNFIFKSVMGEKAGGIEYSEDEMLVMGAKFVPAYRNTDIALLTEDDAGNAVSSAEYTAGIIAKMLEDKVHVTNRDGTTTRECSKRDFCILLRSKKHAAEYIKALDKYSVSAYSEETSGYLRSREISVLISLLRIVDNPLLDTSFAAVLMSPMFGFTDDEMVKLRLSGPGMHIFELVSQAAYSEDSAAQKQLVEKCLNVCTVVDELRLHAATLSLTDFIRRIYDRTDFMSVIQICRDSGKKKANLRVLLEYAKIYEESAQEGLSGFLRYIDRISELGGDLKQGQTVSTSEDAVMIKTIHKSKGLEFPFVFLCETTDSFNKTDLRKNIAMSFENGIGFRLQNAREFQRFTTLPFELISAGNQSESLSEEMRLLYVALTRARERLFIPLSIGSSQKKKLMQYARNIHENQGITQELASGASSMSDWILMSLLTHHSSKQLRELSGYDMFYTDKSEFNIDFEVIDYSNEPQSTETSSDSGQELIPADDQTAQRLREGFEFCYSNMVSALPAKVSVSDVAKSREDFDIVLKKPEFIRNEGNLSASEKGTIIHSILQHADLRCLKTDPQGEADRLIEAGFISKNDAEQIDMSMIDKFTASSLFEQIVSSERIEREKKFLMKISDLDISDELLCQYKATEGMIQGIIDMYFVHDNQLVLVDYKTDNTYDIRELAGRYGTQLKIYKAALELMEDMPVAQTIIYSLRLGAACVL
ncbi:MAG: helicase-exonuclease AddAB subunit AddA [Oscillospiraceae bacterium]|nr:helicase-exonuclease AddAB subunit AddA [Oscillospiraceae bacterium]